MENVFEISLISDLDEVREVFNLDEASSQVTVIDLLEGIHKYEKGKGSTSDRETKAKLLRVQDFKIVPMIGTNTFLLSYTTIDLETKRKERPQAHLSVFATYDMKFSNEKTSQTPIQIDDGLYMSPIFARETPIAVRCDCPDFIYTWAWELQKRDALFLSRLKKYDPEKAITQKVRSELENELGRKFIGRLPREVERLAQERIQAYIRKRQEKPRPPRHVNYPGCCKHILRMILDMKAEGWIR